MLMLATIFALWLIVSTPIAILIGHALAELSKHYPEIDT